MIKVVYFGGTPELSLVPLQKLIETKSVSLEAVIIKPERPQGRQKTIIASPLRLLAEKHRIDVIAPEKFDENVTKQIRDISPDLFVIVAYGKILPERIISIPARGAINIHPSLLPNYRGPSPVQAALLSGDRMTGISIMLIDEEMDHGPLLKQVDLLIEEHDTTLSLLTKAGDISAPLLIEAIHGYLDGTISPQEQRHEVATYCKMITRDDGQVTTEQTADELLNWQKAFTPWPGLFFFSQEKRYKIADLSRSETSAPAGTIDRVENQLILGTNTGSIHIGSIQPEGKPMMQVEAF
ncbi:MAG: methionyl-tRNA formyltransferase, partial [bacterium]|nr:methionyl-tRNA formyltransferase [bacterium]